MGRKGKQSAMMVDAIETRPVFERGPGEDHPLRVVAKIPDEPRDVQSGGVDGGMKVFVLGKDEKDQAQVRDLTRSGCTSLTEAAVPLPGPRRQERNGLLVFGISRR